MSRPFPGESELISFLKLHIESIYESYHQAEQEEDYSLMDYCQGSIDTTEVYLLKAGVTDYTTYEQYLETATAEWRKA